MIFVTVGTELPFNRLVQEVDAWAGRTGRLDVFAQIGKTDWRPSFIEYQCFLEPQVFADRFARSSVIVSHAGMGTILSALHAGKPILVVPRRASLSEHRNEHQLATAKRMLEMGKVEVAFDETEIAARLDRISDLKASPKITQFAEAPLTDAIRDFIFQRKLHSHAG